MTRSTRKSCAIVILLLCVLGTMGGCEAISQRHGTDEDEHEYKNAVEHGADPTGRKDSTAILTSLHATGKKIHYPNGVYRFNGKKLNLSGGVEFESRSGVTVRNDISPVNILQFDDFGNLVGLVQNHLELNEKKLGGILPMDVGTLVPPPVSRASPHVKADLLAYWYNDFGLEYRRARAPEGAGWIGWYYWSWNFHDAPGDGYDPARHPLLGFYRGDDPVVLDWQCYWLREYGVTGVILYLPSPGGKASPFGTQGWEEPANLNHWVCHLFTDVPNFRGLKYVLTGYSPWMKAATPEDQARVEEQWRTLIERTYLRQDSFYAITRDGKRYPVVYVHEEGALAGVFDHYRGARRTGEFYARIARLFQGAGYGGVAVFARHSIGEDRLDPEALARQGVLHFTVFYSEDHSSGATYAERVANYNPPVGPRTILNVCTARHSQAPHPSKWNCPGGTPALFKELLQKAVTHVSEHDMPRIITCYNVAEWAEGGPGLQPNMKDRFGYLEAVRDAVRPGDETGNGIDKP